MATTQTGIDADPIRVVFADASGPERLRCRLQLSDEDGLALVAEAVDARQAVAVAVFASADVVVVAPDLPGPEGYDIRAELAVRCPRACVVEREPGVDVGTAVRRATTVIDLR